MISCWLSVYPSVLCHISVSQSIILFPDDNLKKYQWIFTQLNVCVDIVEISFRIVNGQILSIFDKVDMSAQDRSIFSFPDDNFSKYQ